MEISRKLQDSFISLSYLTSLCQLGGPGLAPLGFAVLHFEPVYLLMVTNLPLPLFSSIKIPSLSYIVSPSKLLHKFQVSKLNMGNAKHPSHHLFILITLFLAALVVQGIRGSRVQITLHEHQTDGWKRLLIGSVAPVCSYNECKGCKLRCVAEQVPIEGNDPINSAYYYKCVCHHR